MNETERIDDNPSAIHTATGALPADELLDRFARHAQQEADPVQGMLLHQAGQLWEFSAFIKTAIKHTLDAYGEPMQGLQASGPAVEAFIRLHRQCDRFVSIADRISRKPK